MEWTDVITLQQAAVEWPGGALNVQTVRDYASRGRRTGTRRLFLQTFPGARGRAMTRRQWVREFLEQAGREPEPARSDDPGRAELVPTNPRPSQRAREREKREAVEALMQ